MSKDYRSMFPILKKKINGYPLIYFDHSATSQKPQSVIDSVSGFYERHNANVHRSMNPLAQEATDMFENARKKVASFINAKSSREVIFTRNATESINIVAKTWGRRYLKSGDRVAIPITEHHSNIVPWLQLKKEKGIEVYFLSVKEDGHLRDEEVKKILRDKKTKLLSFALVSNVLGVVHPVKEMVRYAAKHGVVTLVDACQSVAHMPMSVEDIGCDFLAFSGHKMYGPTGIGVLYGKADLLEDMPEFLGGGDMIHEVFCDGFTVNELPYKFEAGTPDIAGAAGMAAAIDFIHSVGYPRIYKNESALGRYFLKRAKRYPFVQFLIQNTFKDRLPIFAFHIQGVHPHDIADLLGEKGICIRAGHHCTQLLHSAFGVNASARASLAFYNTSEEIDIFFAALEEVYRKLH
ncbi:MAG: cysteine desulfurase [Parcubacteria group bacterium]|nr:cysteine desulfurase [Parcubacteria group bacterium]